MGDIDPGALVARTLELEAARLLALAARVRGAEALADQIAAVDAALEAALGDLERHGIAYPGYVIGARYELSGPEYLVLQLALMPHHATADFLQLMALQGSVSELPRMSHALALLAPPAAWPEVEDELRERPLFTESLVRLQGDPDPALIVHRAVLELFGMGDL